MPGVVETTGAPAPSPRSALGYTVSHQKVELDIDFATRSLKGKTEITIHPHHKDLKFIRLNFRQGELKRLNVSGKAPTTKYTDPYDSFRLYSAHQYLKLAATVDPLVRNQGEYELVVTIPKSVKIEELDPFSLEAQNQLLLRASGAAEEITEGAGGPKPTETSLPRFTSLVVYAEFTIDNIRDGFQFVGVENGDRRYPHGYTTNCPGLGTSCCLFPCVDDLSSRCTWEISVRCPRTIGDIFQRKGYTPTTNGVSGVKSASSRGSGIASDDEALDMAVACSGDMTDEILDPKDPTKKTVSFACSTPLAAQQVGFAVGPFEYVNLSEYRESDEDDQLGRNAIPVHAFCLPNRTVEVRNTCLPMAKAIDFISLSYGSYPFSSYKMCFVDDLLPETAPAAGFSICSNRLLFPEDIIDLMYDSSRRLVYALASQWIGVNIIPAEPTDMWVIVGVAYYITDMFMRKLCGNNEYRFRLKQMSDKICDMDFARPSIWDLGAILDLDPSEMDFLSLKAPLVLFILERRLTKASGKATVSRIISRTFLQARMGDMPNGSLATRSFQRTCERMGHTKLDPFFQQWVFGAGCPRFNATQRFNKKKLVVEIMIKQVQSEQPPVRDLERDMFLRDIKEEVRNVYAGAVQHVFTGSMTIRIHEADGTPYEHIVEIKEGVTKIEIPYNTKYKRLKRNKRQRERAAATTGGDQNAEGQEDTLLYCLGDVLQTEEEVQNWKIVDWSKEDEDSMGQESYEWIRMDADFEWICKMSLTMPGYMYLSQLQQDRDVVAQLDSLQYMIAQREHPLISSIFVRTLMDKRYFHGIRVFAAQSLVLHAKEEVRWIGLDHLERAFQELFCLPNSPMTRSNDFSDRAAYELQLAIPEAIAQVRDSDGKTPMRVKRFLYDKLKFNDNSNNQISDCFYVSTLMKAMCHALLGVTDKSDDGQDFDMEREVNRQEEEKLDKDCIVEIDRYRRMDEWSSSFQNIYSRTALKCQQQLMQAGRMDPDIMLVLQYTRASTFDLLRRDAFEVLMELDIFSSPELIKWFLYTMSSDSSLWLRLNLHHLFGKALAYIAFGDRDNKNQPAQQDGLIIEQESSTEVRQATLARKQTVSGAIEALKKDISENTTLKDCLWAACNSTVIGALELCDLLDICRVLYNPITQKLVKLKFPRYWRVQNLGKGKLHFTKNGSYRTSPQPKPGKTLSGTQSIKRKREETNNPPPLQRLTFKVPKQSATSSPTGTQVPPPPPPAPPLSLKLKLKVGNSSGAAGRPK
ncbi:hypothetical protein FQN54_003375 [Arachnomyces sp. PD_36]|nr:hypothetical protein FQN54_003375 [Arachnomyces sp. PD_36]